MSHTWTVAVLGILSLLCVDASTSNWVQDPVTPDCETDVVFVIDRSGSMVYSYDHIKDFMKKAVEGIFKLSGPRSKVHVGIVTFNANVTVEVGIGKYADKAALLGKIDHLRGTDGQTAIYKGLHKMHEMFRADENKSKTAIIITDGEDNFGENLAAEAKAAHNDDIKIISIGIGGKINLDQIRTMASKPNYAFSKPSVDELENVLDIVIKHTCEPVQPDCTSDVVVVVDRSYTMKPFYKHVKAFVRKFVNGIPDLSPDGTRVGIVTFYKYTNIWVKIGGYADKAALLRKIDKLPRPHVGTIIYEGLEKMLQMFKADKRFANKSYRPYTAIIITDGTDKSGHKLKEAAKAAKDYGIKIISVGIGGDINQDKIRTMASNSRYALMRPSAGRLVESCKTILKYTCESGPTNNA